MTENLSQFEQLQKTLLDKKEQVVNSIKDKHQDSLDWLKRQGVDVDEIREKQVSRLAAAAATGILLLAPGSMAAKQLPGANIALLEAGPGKDVASLVTGEDPGGSLAGRVKELLASNDPDKEKQIEKIIEDKLAIKAKYELEGYRMNVNTGLIGAEQHLYRWPGDTLEAHLENSDDRLMYGPSGIAPNRGAWGYFGTAPSKEARDQERYYFALQTFLSPNWQADPRGTYNFFKFRKMIAINTNTGQTVVGVGGDAGPAKWTGKSYGGSPEIMHHLGYGAGSRKGEILILFVEDTDNSIPLGPVSLGGGK